MKALVPSRIMLAAVSLLLAGTAAYAQGRIEVVGGDTYDWGSVSPAKLKTVIEVKNVGDDTLKITNVRPSCGCTTAPIDKSTLMPGESGKISVEIDMSTRTGPTTKTITVASSDPKNPTQIIYLKADVKRAMTFSPTEYFLINNGIVGTEATTSVRITNSGEEAFTVFPPEFVQGNVRVRFDMTAKKEVKPGEELELKAYVTPLEAGSANGIIRIATSSNAPEYKSRELPIYGSIAAPAAVPSLSDTKSSHK
jgi:uncharacterized membrane protein